MSEVESETRGRNRCWLPWGSQQFPPACPNLSPQSSAWLGGTTAWSFHLRSCLFRAWLFIAVLIVDVCLAVTSSFGCASAVWRHSESFKTSRVWQSSHSGAALFSVVQSLLWGILYQNRQMDVDCFAILALPLVEIPQLRSSGRNHKETGAQVIPCQVFDSWMFKAYACTLGENRRTQHQKFQLLVRIKL